jgi:NADH dehydrogenase
VIGAGPTGVEMAGQIAELARVTLRSDVRSADPGSGRILLIEAAERDTMGRGRLLGIPWSQQPA